MINLFLVVFRKNMKCYKHLQFRQKAIQNGFKLDTLLGSDSLNTIIQEISRIID